jgi:UDP-N-acetylmuramoyl-tripeptide--D-alanyl-D-alanine ligase
MTDLWRQMAGARQVRTFAVSDGSSPSAAAVTADASAQARWDVQAQAWRIQMRLGGEHLTVQLTQPGLHNVHNALAAAVCARAAGESLQAIQQGLEAFRPVKGRSQVRALAWAGATATLVDDSYNANPDSVLAAIEVLHGLPGPRWLVLGDMGEVGAQGTAFHAEVGVRARERGLEHLWCVGALAAASAQAAQPALAEPSVAPLSAAPEVRHFDTVEALLSALQAPAASLPSAASILVKGSRFMRMERVVEALVTRSEAAGGASVPTTRPEQAHPDAPEAPTCC